MATCGENECKYRLSPGMIKFGKPAGMAKTGFFTKNPVFFCKSRSF